MRPMASRPASMAFRQCTPLAQIRGGTVAIVGRSGHSRSRSLDAGGAGPTTWDTRLESVP